MENFFKAHSVKKGSLKARHKNENSGLKNKLKVMLQGYKRNDNATIREATELSSRAYDSDADFALEVNSVLQDDSDFELVDAADAQLSPPPAVLSSASRSPSSSPACDRSHASVSTSTTSPDCSPSPTPLSSSYVSLKESENVGAMMDTINCILDSDSSDENGSFAGDSDVDSSVHDMDTFVPVDNSMEFSNTSSSASEFDANGLLASSILEKIKCSTVAKIKGDRDKNKKENSPKYVHGKAKNVEKEELSKKTLSNKTEIVLDSWPGLSNLKTKKVEPIKDTSLKIKDMKVKPIKSTEFKVKTKKVKPVIDTDLKVPSPYISIDASKLYLPDQPNFFTNYICPNNSAPRTSDFQRTGYDFFRNRGSNLKNAEINECPVSTSDSSIQVDSDGPRPKMNEWSNGIPNSLISESISDDYHPRRLSSEASEGSLDSPSPSEAEDMTIDEIMQEETDQSPSNSVEFQHLKNSCILILRHPSQIYIHGKVKATALCGEADVMGYRLQERNVEIYAPRLNFALNIKTVAESSSHFGLFGKLTSLGLSIANTEDTVISLEEHDCVIHLEPLPDVKLDFVENEFSSDVFKSNKIVTEQFPEAAETLSCTLYTDKPPRSFEENPIWPEIAKFGLENQSKGVVCGGKGTGKSTFLKYYINKQLKNGPILLIDLDPGQCELTVAGTISVTVVNDPLLGPNFTHLRKPLRTLNVGLVNINDNIDRYMLAVRHLLEYATTEDECRCLPWIVNTMGMSNALGLKLISYIILLVKPTFVVQMDSNVQKKCFGTLLNAQEIKRLFSEEYEDEPMFRDVDRPDDLGFQYYMSSPKLVGRESFLTAKDERYLSYLSYFSQVLSRTNKMFFGTKPYVLQLESLKIATSCIVNDEFIMDIINAKIVALCEEHTETEGKIFTLEENSLICHGHGIVRAVDLESGAVYIITPESRDTLAKVNVLLYSDAHPDLVVGNAALADRTCIPFRAALWKRSRHLMKSPRRRFNPLPHLLKMKRLGAQKLK